MLRLALLALLAAACQPASAQASGRPSAATYDALRAELLNGNTDIDYTLFRLSYAETSGYAPRDPSPRLRRNRMFDAFFRDSDTDRAGAIADTALGINYTDLNAHYVRLSIAIDQEDEPPMTFFQATLDGLLASILHSADGRTPDDPLVLISLHEAYAVLGLLGLRATGRTEPATCNGRPCLRLPVSERDSGTAFSFYLDLSAAEVR